MGYVMARSRIEDPSKGLNLYIFSFLNIVGCFELSIWRDHMLRNYGTIHWFYLFHNKIANKSIQFQIIFPDTAKTHCSFFTPKDFLNPTYFWQPFVFLLMASFQEKDQDFSHFFWCMASLRKSWSCSTWFLIYY